VDAVAALSEHPLATHAVGEVVGEVLEALGTGPDLAVLLVGSSHAGALDDIAAAVEALLRPVTLERDVAPDVYADGRRSEDGVGIALLAIATTSERTGTEVVEGHRWIGGPWSVTSADGSAVRELDGRPALECVQEVITSLDRDDRMLARLGLHLDVDNEVLTVRGGDPATNVVAVDGTVDPGAVAWLAVRDDAVEDARVAAVLAHERAAAGVLATRSGRPRTSDPLPVPVIGRVTADPLATTSITWFGRA
jgi:small ligand-binding sensory domain FIST